MTRDALIIGINQYPLLKDTPASQAKNLTTPGTDAEAIARLLETYGDFRVTRLPARNINGKVQVDPDKLLKAEELEEAIANLFLPKSGKPPETALLFFAGHGLRKQLNSLTESFLATSDASPSKHLWGMSLQTLRRILQESKVQQQVIWLDCCFSGELLNFKDTEMGRQGSGSDRFFIAASRDYEVAYQQLDGKHGVLTGVLLQGLDPQKVPEYEWITNQKLAVSVQQDLQVYYYKTKIPQSPLISNHGEPIKLIEGRSRQKSQLQLKSDNKPVSQSSSIDLNICREYLQEADNIFDINFFGRTEELEEIQHLILIRKYRLVRLVGMTGIGKTCLAAKLTERVKNEFQYVIWKNLRTASSFEDILNDLLNFFSVNSENFTLSSTDRVQCLINYLKDNKCLLVLDDLTEILDGDDLGKVYKEGWQQFGRFLEQTALQQHKSSILITCHESPQNLEEPKVKKNSYQFKVKGLNCEDIQINLYGLHTQPGSEDDWEYFVNYYGGNPGVLEIAARWILSEYDGDISNFVEYYCKYGSHINAFEEIHELLNKQFIGLNRDEKKVMYLLAIKSEPITSAEVNSAISSKNISIEKLKNLSLIKETAYGYTQVPMVMDYVTERIVNEVVDDICNQNSQLINDYPLLDAQAKDYIKDIQKRRIIQPIIDRLLHQDKMVGQYPIQERLNLMLSSWRQKHPIKGNIGGNIINLLLQLDVNLKNTNFSNIPLGYVDLHDKDLQGVDISNSDLSHANFAENLGCIDSIAFSYNGEYFATAETNGNIRLWQTKIYKQVRLFSDEQSNSQIWSIAFSPDGTILASAGEDKTIRLWNVTTGEKIKEIKDNQCVYSVAFTQDGKILVSAGDERIAIWNASSGNLHQEISILNQVSSIAINKHDILASACQDGTVILWDIKNVTHPAPLYTWREHTKTVRCVVFNHDSTTVASGSEDGTIKLWKINSEKSFTTLNKSEIKQVWTLAFSKDGKILASGSSDENPSGIDEHHNIRLWNIENGECFRKLGAHKNQLRAVSFCPQDKQSNLLVSGGDDHTIKIWDVNTGKRQKTIQGYTNRIWSVAFSPCGKKLVIGSEDNRIRIWDIQNKQYIQKLLKHTDWVWSVVFSPDGEMIASGSEDNTIRLWQLKNGQYIYKDVLREHTDRVRVVAFSPDGKKLVSGGNDRKVILWDLSKSKYSNKILGETLDGWPRNEHTRRILSLAFSPNGNFIASSSRDKTIRLWNLHTDEVKILGTHDNQVHSIAFSPDGNTLVSGGFDNKLKLWDIKKQECIYSFEEHEDRILCVAFHPGGIGLASSGHDKTIRLWSIKTKKCIHILRGHRGAIESIRFCPKGGILVSSSQDQTIKIWDTWAGECIDTLEPDSKPYEGMKISGVKGLNEAQLTTLIALGAIAES
ncbi:caspase family protein [Nostoc sp. CALU 546]|uniref:WD40 domain-containing protein n=1 Tax=Nostoc sp. CALU 546 TaxID=1867241 RepID=UPI003B66D891